MASDVRTEIGTYKKTKHRLETVVGELAFDSTAWIFRSRFNGVYDRKHYNGHRDNVLLVPTISQPDDITLVVWFHGLGGFSEKTFTRVLTQIQEISREGYALAVAIPEMPWSINTMTKRSRQGRVWQYPGDLGSFVQENKDRLVSWATTEHGLDLETIRVVIVGHSAGGSAISSAAVEGGLCELKPQAVIWSDASYGRWLNDAWDGCLGDSETTTHLLVRRWDKPHHNAAAFMKIFKTSPYIKYRILDRKTMASR